ncbi:AAA family ATPase [Streptomyces sp. NBC_01591]|uniref:AAA family ATPase n=1 Tax=Streptomyces sp. NBC_01591 TaxID=2975888 RepID=UPI003FA3679F
MKEKRDGCGDAGRGRWCGTRLRSLPNPGRFTERPSWPAFDGVEILTPVSSVAFVVISGLPGSGKSTLARSLARRLSLPVIDKDVILESLYDSLGVGDHAWRNRLSRASDDIMFALAADAGRAVLDNWWHHDTAPDRLQSLAGLLIEVHCDCDVALAAERFQAPDTPATSTRNSPPSRSPSAWLLSVPLTRAHSTWAVRC